MGCSPQLTDTIRSRHGRVRANAARSVVISGSSDRCEANLLRFRPAGVPRSLSARSRGWFAGRSTRGRRAGGLRRRQRATGDDAVPCTADRPLDWGTSWNCPRQGRCRVVLRRRPAASGPHAHALGTGSGAGSSAASNLPGCRAHAVFSAPGDARRAPTGRGRLDSATRRAAPARKPGAYLLRPEGQAVMARDVLRVCSSSLPTPSGGAAQRRTAPLALRSPGGVSMPSRALTSGKPCPRSTRRQRVNTTRALLRNATRGEP
jgi:hypothetical protein